METEASVTSFRVPDVGRDVGQSDGASWSAVSVDREPPMNPAAFRITVESA
jgi:hypothetical protein